jgi:aryl-alcohol dehydrogenase-like predicted oxidoreductase
MTIGGDLAVNRIGYGAMCITGTGIWGPPADKSAALATLGRAVELDIDLIDTADSYGPGMSEELIAEALHPYPAGLVIATKGGWEPGFQSAEAQSAVNIVQVVNGNVVHGSIDQCAKPALRPGNRHR